MINDPLDKLFNVTGPTDFEEKYDELLPGEIAPVHPSANPVAKAEAPKDVKDEDDELVEERLDQVYDAAMDAFETQNGFTEIIDPKYAARNAEVSANFLNIALNAAATRAKVKVDRKRTNSMAGFVPYAQGKSTTNVVIASREEILKMVTIDGEAKEVK